MSGSKARPTGECQARKPDLRGNVRLESPTYGGMSGSKARPKSFDIEEGIAGQEHLAEVGPGATAGVGVGQVGISGGLTSEELPGRVTFLPGRRAAGDQEEGPRDAGVTLIRLTAGAAALGCRRPACRWVRRPD